MIILRKFILLFFFCFLIASFIFLLRSISANQLLNVSDTMSRLKVNELANHTIQFTTPSGVEPSKTITLTFPIGFDLGNIDWTDIDLEINETNINLATTPSGATWGAISSNNIITFTNGNVTVAANSSIKIKIGTHSNWQTIGDVQIKNPNIVGTQMIAIGGTFGDNATLAVVILDDDQVVVTATVGTILSFFIEGLPTSTALGGANSASTDSVKIATSNSLPFGDLLPNQGVVLGQKINVTTNAGQGYMVTIEQNHDLISGSNDIDDFLGTNTDPQKWETTTHPTGTAQNIDSGWFGYTTSDETLSGASPARFGSGLDRADYWAGFTQSNAPYEIAYNNSAVVNGESTNIGFKVEVNTYQPAGTYTNKLTYICTSKY